MSTNMGEDKQDNALEKKTDQNRQESQKKQNGILTGKETAFVAGVFVIGALLGVLIMTLVLKQPWKKTKVKEESGVQMVSGKYDVQDCVELGKYNGITVSIAVTQDDLDTEIENLQDEYKTYEEKKGTVQDGDMIYADYTGYVNGTKIEEVSDSDYIEIGTEDASGFELEGFAEAFIGAKTDKEISFDIDVPAGTYGEDAIDGKTLTFKATVKYICGTEIVPDYNDDFVKMVSDSEYKTVEEYNAYLRKELAAEYEEEKSEYSWSDVVESSKVKMYPENMLKEAQKKVLQGYYDMADLYGMEHDEIFQTFGRENEQDFVDNDLEELAKDTVKEQLVTRAIAVKEKINYTKQEYDAIVEEEYGYNSEAYSSKEKYEEADRAYLEETALQTAVKNWIAERANYVTEESEDGER